MGIQRYKEVRLQKEPNSKIDLLIRDVNSAFAKEHNTLSWQSMMLPSSPLANRCWLKRICDISRIHLLASCFKSLIHRHNFCRQSALCSDYFSTKMVTVEFRNAKMALLTSRAVIAKFHTQGRERGIVPAKRALQHIVEKSMPPRPRLPCYCALLHNLVA